jgi:hypothetical protein
MGEGVRQYVIAFFSLLACGDSRDIDASVARRLAEDGMREPDAEDGQDEGWTGRYRQRVRLHLFRPSRPQTY